MLASFMSKQLMSIGCGSMCDVVSHASLHARAISSLA